MCGWWNDGHAPCDHRIVNLKGTCTVQWHESIESSVRVVGSHDIKPNGGGGRGAGEGRWIFSPSQSLPRVVTWLVGSCRLVFSDLTGGWRRWQWQGIVISYITCLSEVVSWARLSFVKRAEWWRSLIQSPFSHRDWIKSFVHSARCSRLERCWT